MAQKEDRGHIHRVQLYIRVQSHGLVGAAADALGALGGRGAGSLGHIPPGHRSGATYM